MIKTCFLLHYKKILLYSSFLKAPEPLRLRNIGCSCLCLPSCTLCQAVMGTRPLFSFQLISIVIKRWIDKTKEKGLSSHHFLSWLPRVTYFFGQFNILLYFPGIYLTIKSATATISKNIKKYFNCSNNATSTLPFLKSSYIIMWYHLCHCTSMVAKRTSTSAHPAGHGASVANVVLHIRFPICTDVHRHQNTSDKRLLHLKCFDI